MLPILFLVSAAVITRPARCYYKHEQHKFSKRRIVYDNEWEIARPTNVNSFTATVTVEQSGRTSIEYTLTFNIKAKAKLSNVYFTTSSENWFDPNTYEYIGNMGLAVISGPAFQLTIVPEAGASIVSIDSTGGTPDIVSGDRYSIPMVTGVGATRLTIEVAKQGLDNGIYIFDFEKTQGNRYAVITDTFVNAWDIDMCRLFEENGKYIIYDVDSAFAQTTAYDSIKQLDMSNLLAEVTFSEGKISNIIVGSDVMTSDAEGIYGRSSPSGALLSIPGKSPSIVIDSEVVVFVNYDGDFSIGSRDIIRDKVFKHPFQYILNKSGRISALVVDAVDVMDTTLIMVTASDYVDGYFVVKGLAFKDGIVAAEKYWRYIDDGLHSDLVDAMEKSGNYTIPASFDYPFPEMVEFRITEDNILNKPSLISCADDRRISGVNGSGVEYDGNFETGSGMISIGFIDPDTGEQALLACEATVCLYYIDGDEWRVQRPTMASMRDYARYGYRFIFLKSNKNLRYDIIIMTSSV